MRCLRPILKKALGARTGRVMVEYLLEAAVIGGLGGVAGYLLGLGLATLAGVFPAFRAARLDPVRALHSH